jgi:TetR/AcrR family transcriptional regulator, tetracycline repressor protein
MRVATSRRRPLSRDRVVTAALRIVDQQGLDALTMRALGRELRVDPMAVYHHLPNKAAILDGVVEAVLREVNVEVPAGRTWTDRLAGLAHGYRDALQAHPNALPVVATRPDISAAALRILDTALGILLRAGFEPADALKAVHATSTFVMGHALDEAGLPLGVTEDLSVAEIAAAQQEVVGSGDYPNLVEVAGVAADLGPDDTFEAGLAALIAGFNGNLSPVRRGR